MQHFQTSGDQISLRAFVVEFEGPAQAGFHFGMITLTFRHGPSNFKVLKSILVFENSPFRGQGGFGLSLAPCRPNQKDSMSRTWFANDVS
jgi:hypothetical protein